MNITNDRKKWLILLAVTVLIAVLLSPFASSHPDGLERVAEDLGFLEQAEEAYASSPLSEYEVPWNVPGILKVGLAGLAGVVLMLAVLIAIGKWMARGKDAYAQENHH